MKQKLYLLLSGLIIMGCVVWVTHIVWDYRVINKKWEHKNSWNKKPSGIKG
jgi:hypothetical protein